MTKNRYSVLAIRSDADDAIQTTCNSYWHDNEGKFVRLIDIDPDRPSKMLYFDAFSKILIKEGDLIVWRWNGTIAGTYPSFSE